jgi:hypothetical protein
VFIQPAGKLHDADRRHAVGKDRKIGLTGDKIETGGVNKRDAHNVVLEGSVFICRCRNRLKMTPSRSSAVNSPVISTQRLLGQAQFFGKQFKGRQADALDDMAGAAATCSCAAAKYVRAQVALAGNEDIFGLMPAGDAQQFLTQQVDTLIGLGRQGNCGVGFVVALSRRRGQVDLVVDVMRCRRSGRRARISRSASVTPVRASTSSSTTSARSISCQLRSMPIFSTSSSVSRRPAVSMMCSGIPSIWMVERRASRVVPAIGVTMARSSPASRLSSEDLPTFGWPASTTCRPDCSSLP